MKSKDNFLKISQYRKILWFSPGSMLSASQSHSRSRSRTLLIGSLPAREKAIIHLPFLWVLIVFWSTFDQSSYMNENNVQCFRLWNHGRLTGEKYSLVFKLETTKQQNSSGRTTECLNLSGNRAGMKKKKNTKTIHVSQKQCCIFIYLSHIYFVRFVFRISLILVFPIYRY